MELSSIRLDVLGFVYLPFLFCFLFNLIRFGGWTLRTAKSRAPPVTKAWSCHTFVSLFWCPHLCRFCFASSSLTLHSNWTLRAAKSRSPPVTKAWACHTFVSLFWCLHLCRFCFASRPPERMNLACCRDQQTSRQSVSLKLACCGTSGQADNLYN